MGRTGIQSVVRTDLQLSSHRLLPAEQIVVGGRYSVRGYRQNLYVRDNAFIASWELRLPLVQNRPWADTLQIAPLRFHGNWRWFFDYGTGWEAETAEPPDRTLYSAGVGLRWAATVDRGRYAVRPRAEIYWGHPFKDVDTSTEDDLQDDGVYFQVGVEAF